MNVPFQNTGLGKYLSKKKVEKTDKNYTHTHIYGICGGKFNITGDDIKFEKLSLSNKII